MSNQWTFSQVPVSATCNSELSDGAYRLLAYLIWRQGNNGKSWPSIPCMAKDLGVSDDTVRRRLRELEQAGYVETTERSGRSSVYIVQSDPPVEVQDEGTQDCGDSPGKSESAPLAKVQGRTILMNDTHERESENDNSAPEEKSSDEEFETLFGAGDPPEQAHPRTPEQHLEETRRSLGRAYARAAGEPWRDFSDGRFKPWNGISVEAQERVAWTIRRFTGLEPVDSEWRHWGQCCAQVYQAADGDWLTIEAGVRAVWQRKPQYRPGHAKGFVDEVRKTRAETKRTKQPTRISRW